MALTFSERVTALNQIHNGYPVLEVFYKASIRKSGHDDFKAFLNAPQKSHRTTSKVKIDGKEVEDEIARSHVENSIKPIGEEYNERNLEKYQLEVMVRETRYNI